LRLPPRQRGDELESSRNVLSSAVAPWPRRRESRSTARASAVIRRRCEAATRTDSTRDRISSVTAPGHPLQQCECVGLAMRW
jgi:hypothetical protein